MGRKGAPAQSPRTVRLPFTTDYSSLPWAKRWLVNWSRVDIAGVVHDHPSTAPLPTVPEVR